MPAIIPAPGALPSGINALIPDSSGTALIAGTDNGLYSNSSGFWIPAGLSSRVVNSLAMRASKLFVGTCSGVYSIPYKAPVNPTAIAASKGLGATGMDIWPNPASKAFSIRVQSARAVYALLVVRDLLGSEVLRQNLLLKSGANELHVTIASLNLAPGMYVVQVFGEALQATGHVMLN
jgi:hypothetical protein